MLKMEGVFPMNNIIYKKMPISKLKPAEYNPRDITDKARKGLKKSISKFGNVQPIVVNKRTHNIISGHQRLGILTEQGETHVDVAIVDVSEIEEKALNVALNSNTITGFFTDDIESIIKEIRFNDEDLVDEMNFNDLLDNVDFTVNTENVGKPEKKELKPFNKTHILISFNPADYPEIQKHIDEIEKIPEVEIEQSSN